METHEIRKSKRGYLLRSAAERTQWVLRYKESGQGLAEFCREHGLLVGTFYGWLARAAESPQRRRAKKSCIAFVEAEVKGAGGGLDSGVMELVRGDGVRILLKDAAAIRVLGDWLKEALSC